MSDNTLRIIIENNVPYVKGLLEPYAEVCYLESEDITADAVRDVDALVVRTRNRCNAALLEGSKVRFIATATIGMDHFDREYLSSRGITALNAPGCNAPAVAQYVFASLMQVVNRRISDYTIGVVGVGHVGSIVSRWAKGLGMRVLECDPPRSRAEGGDHWTDLDTIARKADIITFHTPLTRSGEDASYHLANADFFNKLRRAPIIVNAARGPVVDTAALIDAKKRGLVGCLVIDCWEEEPNINLELQSLATIATPHIAGYSLEGKIRASRMAIDSLTDFFALPRVTAAMPATAEPAETVNIVDVIASYDPTLDTAALRANPGGLEKQRNGYNLRREVRQAPKKHSY